jgi:crotonobetaine/carnitine-CoA ligase
VQGHDVRAREQVVQRYLIEHWAAKTPARIYAVFEDGSELSYGELLRQVRSAAAGLQALGVKQGDHVLVWLPNGPDFLRTWFAINYLGAVSVSMNTAYKGGLLEHVIRNSGAQVLVTVGALTERLQAVDRSRLNKAVVLSGDATPVQGLQLLDRSALERDAEPTPLERPIEPWDTQSIYYTSGTTGPSKGVLSSYMQLWTMGRYTVSTRDGALLVDDTDRYMVNLPLFHAGGLAPPTAMLGIGGSISMVGAFNTATFWPTIARTGTTYVILLGVMAAYLVKQPRAPGERDTPLRHALCLPLTEESLEFHKRFGIPITTTFNMSETSCPLISDLNPTVVASCGTPRKGMEVRIVDENDYDVPVGTTGELIIRGDAPWTLFSGYNQNPEATAKAMRNGWFHTGDAFRTDAQGNYFFVDRIKDAIRRRGENISSFEVESAVVLHPAVREAAAVGVPDHIWGECVGLCVVARAPVSEQDVVAFCREHLSPFQVPQRVVFVDELPRNAVGKITRNALRSAFA